MVAELEIELPNRFGISGKPLRGLGKLVLLAGPNGSGKSRLLRYVEGLGGADIAPPDRLPGYVERPNVVPIRTSLAKGNRQGVYDIGTAEASFASHGKALFNQEHPRLKGKSEVAKAARIASAYSRLLEGLIGSPVTPSEKRGELFGREYSRDELSEGQQELLIWAHYLHDQAVRQLSQPRTVALVDEPEKHLHPETGIKLLEYLLENLEDTGQIWVATHSPAIVAHFQECASLYSLNDGHVTYASENPSEVLNGLIGGDVAVERFRGIFARGEEIKFIQYGAQCLCEPAVAAPTGCDPQARQLLGPIRASDGPTRILDYAAGQSRFARELERLGLTEKEVDYTAYNHPNFDEHREAAEHNIARLHPDSSKDRQLQTLPQDDQFDLIVMCNFMHELPINEWLETLHRVAPLLNHQGKLLWLEDQTPRIGELPHCSGYVILAPDELKILFGEVAVLDADEKLTCVAMMKEQLLSANQETLEKALGAAQQRSYDKVREIRARKNRDYRDGRLHAFYAMLVTNIGFALSDLEEAQSS